MRNLIKSSIRGGGTEWRALDLFPNRKYNSHKHRAVVVIDLCKTGSGFNPEFRVHLSGKNDSARGWGPTKSYTFRPSLRLINVCKRTGLSSLRFKAAK